MARHQSSSKEAQLNQLIELLAQRRYDEVVAQCQIALDGDNSVKPLYWYLGLALLLQGEEAEAQTTWMFAMFDGDEAEIQQWTLELTEVLEVEAQRQEQNQQFTTAWMIRQHQREVAPHDVNNLLKLLILSIHLQQPLHESLEGLALTHNLQNPSFATVDLALLLQALKLALEYDPLSSELPAFAEVSLPYICQTRDLAGQFMQMVLTTATELAYAGAQYALAIHYANLCLRINPEELEVLSHLAAFHQDANQFQEGIEVAKRLYQAAKTLPDQIFANFFVLRGLARAGGYWQDVLANFEVQKNLLRSLIQQQPATLDRTTITRLVNATFIAPYIQDTPQENRQIQNQLLALCQSNIQTYAQDKVQQYQQQGLSRPSDPTRILKIGYLSHCFREHSVGWLSRWLFQHHDRDRFQIHTYFVNYRPYGKDVLQDWFIQRSDQAHLMGIDAVQIADQISQDEIDILVDLDSITADISAEVIALKPAPIQVTWLGWDASGLPAVDYFIADPYVLPDSAQDYYTEKIYRLPQTYIAVDGFEVGVPTLRRDQLDIPSDAVVYFSSQVGYKRHPETVRAQMKILKAVPNSFFLIKGIADETSIRRFFGEMAAEEGVSGDRLRFLPNVASEAVHRANLTIADVVLDTYPYNGATTTLETLWMEIPLVTRVGEQFAARNSYTMMMNAGITEGIAWTEQEYIDWGIRLGLDPKLRQQVTWKLRQTKQSAPLWNAKQFTQNIEDAYAQMWATYLDQSR